MIGAYLMVAAALALAASYVAIIHYLLSHVERRDLSALGDSQPSKRPAAKAKPATGPYPDALPARA